MVAGGGRGSERSICYGSPSTAFYVSNINFSAAIGPFLSARSTRYSSSSGFYDIGGETPVTPLQFVEAKQ